MVAGIAGHSEIAAGVAGDNRLTCLVQGIIQGLSPGADLIQRNQRRRARVFIAVEIDDL